MFEQSLVIPTPGSKRWTFALSLTLQAAALTLLLLMPLIYTERLSQVMMRSSLFAPPLPPPPPPQPIPQLAQAQTLPRAARVFTPLTAFLAHHTPKAIQDLANDIFEPAPAQVCASCVVGSTGTPGAIPGLSTAMAQPPPPPTAVPEKKPEPVRTAPIRVGGDVMAAKMVRRVLPVYPTLAKQARVSGVVRLQGVISKEGTIQQLQVISGHPLLVAAAVEAVKQWVYRPTLLNGEPVEVIAPIDVNFTLSGN
jgi:protein TonB